MAIIIKGQILDVNNLKVKQEEKIVVKKVETKPIPSQRAKKEPVAVRSNKKQNSKYMSDMLTLSE